MSFFFHFGSNDVVCKHLEMKMNFGLLNLKVVIYYLHKREG